MERNGELKMAPAEPLVGDWDAASSEEIEASEDWDSREWSEFGEGFVAERDQETDLLTERAKRDKGRKWRVWAVIWEKSEGFWNIPEAEVVPLQYTWEKSSVGIRTAWEARSLGFNSSCQGDFSLFFFF